MIIFFEFAGTAYGSDTKYLESIPKKWNSLSLLDTNPTQI